MDKIDAAGLLVKLGDLILLGRRSKVCESLSGYWAIPGGAIELNETPEEAALREFLEETDVQINQQISYLTRFSTPNGGTFFVYYTEVQDLIFPSSDAKDAFEHDEWGFFKIEKNCLPTPITKETIKAILMTK
jgi:8-oxo-dGTP pyrophosphatase MutT (NUDIX family)